MEGVVKRADLARFINRAAASDNPVGGVTLATLSPKVCARHGVRSPVLTLTGKMAKKIWSKHGKGANRKQWAQLDMDDWPEIQRMLDTLDALPQKHGARRGWLYLLPPFKHSVITHADGRRTAGKRVGLALVVDRDQDDPDVLTTIAFFRVSQRDAMNYQKKHAAGKL